MADVLARYSGLDSIQVISHGSTGALYLGGTVLSSGNMSAYESQLQAIGASLSLTGDLLLYGCNVAVGELGSQFVQEMAPHTGADVAASTNLTGQGGDWILESTTAAIETQGLVLPEASITLANQAPVVTHVWGFDTAFSGDGIVTTPIGTSHDFAHAIALQSDGKIVVAGGSYNGAYADLALVRYKPDGSLDNSFSGNGWLVTDFYGGDDYGTALLILPGGQIVVAGYADNGTDYDFALARYR